MTIGITFAYGQAQIMNGAQVEAALAARSPSCMQRARSSAGCSELCQGVRATVRSRCPPLERHVPSTRMLSGA
jgi:hypothetical protein